MYSKHGNLFDVALIRSSSISDDPRASKIIQTLSKKYRLIVLCWDRSAKRRAFELLAKNVHVRYFRLRAPYGRIQLLLLYPLFWLWVLGNVLRFKPKIIHGCDLDALIPSHFSKLLTSAKIVFDSFDRYAMAFIPPKHRFLYTIVNLFENLLALRSDALITVSEARLSTFGIYRPRIFEVIMNCPRGDWKSIQSTTNPNLNPHTDMTLVYAGLIKKDRGLSILSEALHDIEGVRLVVAGRIYDDSIRKLLKDPRIRYVGVLPYEKALRLQESADVIPLLYDPSIPINRVANPNKLFEAMMLGIPIMTNVCGDIVRTVGCGLVVRYDQSDVKNAIEYLKNNPALRRRMGAKGRIAFARKYNWSLMEKKLLRLYDRLLASK